MARIIYITGGARSGKSTCAETLARQYADVTYIATSEARDDEMAARITHHQARRPAHWHTTEAPLDVVTAYQACDAQMSDDSACLLDCVTMWVTNQMFSREIDWDTVDQPDIDAEETDIQNNARRLIEAVAAGRSDLIVVSNELGMGVVPAYRLGRIFRDIAGRVNQQFAQAAHRAVLMVSGLPIELKKEV